MHPATRYKFDRRDADCYRDLKYAFLFAHLRILQWADTILTRDCVEMKEERGGMLGHDHHDARTATQVHRGDFDRAFNTLVFVDHELRINLRTNIPSFDILYTARRCMYITGKRYSCSC